MRRWLCWVGVLVAAVASGHPADIPSALAKVSADGTVELRVKFDVLSFVLDAQPSELTESSKQALLDETPADLQRRLDEAKGRFLVEGIEGAHLQFPAAEWVLREAESNGRRLPLMLTAVVSGWLGSQASFKFPEVLGTVVLTVEMPYQEPYSEPVEAGQWSAALALPSPSPKPPEVLPAAPITKAVKPGPAKPLVVSVLNSDDLLYEVAPLAGKMPARPTAGTAVPPAPVPLPVVAAPSVPTPVSASRPSAWQSLGRYVAMGFRHIVPEGLDHILFVLGLFLLSRKTKDLLTQISCFTLAHSLTLALSLYGVVRLPASIVEPLIALSIVFVALENLWTAEMKGWRPIVVFGFGLVHGLGFAGALQDAGLARANFLSALVGFNGGVELGQLSVVAAAFLLVGWFRSSPRYRAAVEVPASVAIAVVALVWTLQRIGV